MDDAFETVPASEPDDDTATLMALGVLAYTLETMIHEALGHGGVCLIQGHQLGVVTPLWMRCDVVSAPMVAAGPGANMIAALLSWVALRSGVAEAIRIPLFVWLCFVFNALVAAGYLGVGALTLFGDWAYLFDAIKPAWVWRVGAFAVAAAAYWTLLRVAVQRYAAFAGTGYGAYVKRALVPAIGAAIVAVAAQLYGQGLALSGLILPIVCTLVIGASLTGGHDVLQPLKDVRGFRVAFNAPYVVLALAAALAYVFLIGPGLGNPRPPG